MKRILFCVFAMLASVAGWAVPTCDEVVLHKVVDPQDPTHKNVAYFGTYYNSSTAIVLPSGVSAFVAYYEAGTWQFKDAYTSGKVPANEPVVLYIAAQSIQNGKDEDEKTLSADASKLTVRLDFAENPEEPTFKADGMNDLWGTDAATDLTKVVAESPQAGYVQATADLPAYDADTYFYYALQFHHAHGSAECTDAVGNINERCPHIGFFWMNATGAGFTNGAHKTYLRVAKSQFASSARAQGFDFWQFVDCSEATGVCEVFSQYDGADNNLFGKVFGPSDKVYDLSGRLVATPRKGMYIKNGKKTVR